MIRNPMISYCISAILAGGVAAQVNGPGPSDPNDFDTVINLPIDQVSIDGNIGNNNGNPTPTIQLNVSEGGRVGDRFRMWAGSELNISGGSVGVNFWAGRNSEVNISGGSVGHFAAFAGLVNISGGSIGLNALSSGVVNISGGTVGPLFEISPNTEVNISGGSVGYGFSQPSHYFRDKIEFYGAEFELNGVDFSGSTITLSEDDVFTGTFADGSSFIFYSGVGNVGPSDIIRNVKLTAATLPPIDETPQVVQSNISAIAPTGLRSGQKLTLQAGGILGDNFAVVDAILDIDGGVVGTGLETARSTLNVTDGNIHDDIFAYSGSIVNISGGNVGKSFYAYSNSVVNINGGTVGQSFKANLGSKIRICGGTVGDHFEAHGSLVDIQGGSVGNFFGANIGSVINISGGSVGIEFRARVGSEVNLYGRKFFLDGDLLETLVQGESFVIANRGGKTLSGTLTDGTAFSFDLNDAYVAGEDFFDVESLLTVTLVPEPTSAMLLLFACVGLPPRRRPAGVPN